MFQDLEHSWLIYRGKSNAVNAVKCSTIVSFGKISYFLYCLNLKTSVNVSHLTVQWLQTIVLVHVWLVMVHASYQDSLLVK